MQALPKAIAEYPIAADQRSDLIPAIGSIKVNFTRLDRREGAAVADEAVPRVTAIKDREIVLVDAA